MKCASGIAARTRGSCVALRALNGDERLTWVGRPMSARSYTTARLMEHWVHGLDILEAAGVAPVDTDRLRHIALLGHLTRDFAYRTHGLEPPSTPCTSS